jgi:predicted phage terminase large subunit-like protein
MQFGLNFFPCVEPAEKSAEQYFREAIHLASLTDELGYTHVRQVEHYFKPYGGYSPNPLIFLTAVAQRTRKVRLITGAVLPALDCWRKQAATDEGVDAFLDLVKQWRPIGWACEKGQLANAIEPFLRQRQRQRSIFCAMEMFPTKGDKSVRCQSIRGRLAVGNMIVPTHAEWWPEVRAELLGFPAAKWDDVPDALGLCGQILDRMSAPSVPTPPKPRKLLSTDPALCNMSLTELFEANERRHQKSGRI